MQRENHLYIGMDLHKKVHTAVLTNCWNEKLEVIEIENKPSEFNKLAKRVNKRANKMGLSPIYGLENAYGYGRSLAVWLIEQGYVVKDVNPALSCEQRKSAPTTEKNDEHDAHCVATVLINNLHKLPDAKPEDAHWTLAQLVNRRDNLVKDGMRLKNGLHEQIAVAYPSYHQFFCEIDRKTALYFWKKYPSPIHLQNKSADELYTELKVIARVTKKEKADLILDCVQNDGDTKRDFQDSRDFITQSLARCLENQKEELAFTEKKIDKMLLQFDYKLTTVPGISTAFASKLIAEIGNISRFKCAQNYH